MESRWALPCSRYSGERPTDLVLKDGANVLPGDVAVSPIHGRAFGFTTLDDGCLFVSWPGLFDFLISSDGSLIWGRPSELASLDAFQAYLLGQVMSFTLLRRGTDSLHATVVNVGGHGLALIGPSGAGKSSLAAALLQRGGRLVTDDLLVTRRVAGTRVALAGPRRIKLFPDSAKALLPAETRGEGMNPLSSKSIYPLEDEQTVEAVPLRAIFALRPPSGSSRITLRRLGGLTAFREIAQHTFNSVYRGEDRLALHVRSIADIADDVPILSLTYPRLFEQIADVTDKLLAWAID